MTTTKTLPWVRSEIVGHRFELVSIHSVEVFSFSPNGTVPAIVGTKKYLAGPIFSWSLDPDGKLVVKDGNIRIILQKIASKDSTVEVLRNGETATYAVTKKK